MKVPNEKEVDYPLKPPFKVAQMSDGDFGVWDGEHVIVEGIPFRNKENAEWICDALNAFVAK
jgi:hypothetical protein